MLRRPELPEWRVEDDPRRNSNRASPLDEVDSTTTTAATNSTLYVANHHATVVHFFETLPATSLNKEQQQR